MKPRAALPDVPTHNIYYIILQLTSQNFCIFRTVLTKDMLCELILHHLLIFQKHLNPETETWHRNQKHAEKNIAKNSPWIILLLISHLKSARLSSVDTFDLWKPGWKDCPLKSPPSGLFWCYEKSTCSLWLWRCSRCGCPLWCARAGNACGERERERERWRAYGRGSWGRWRDLSSQK